MINLTTAVTEEDQNTGKRTLGIVSEMLTKNPIYPYGVKVKLTSGKIGRAKEVILPTSHDPQAIPSRLV